MLVFAHTGCRAPEVASTLGIAGAAGIAVFRPWRRRDGRDRLLAFLAPLLIATVITGGACASKTQQSSNRPTTSAKIAIEAPTPNETTPPDLTLKVRLDGGTLVQRTTGKLTPTEGHIHVTLDGTLVSMPFTLTYDLHGLSPGAHNLRVEFVAVDHAPFKNRPVAAVLFNVAP
jgi:hypothetical protein